MMRHTEKTVTVYHREWDGDKGIDIYHRTVLQDVSFFSRISTTVSTDGLAAACEGVLRIPMAAYSDTLVLKNGDLVCEGALDADIKLASELDKLCPHVFTIVGITRNTAGRCPHVKVVCK